MGIRLAEVAKADEIERGIDAVALLLEDAARIEPGRDIVPDRRPRKQRRILKDENTRRIWPVDQRAFGRNGAGRRLLKPEMRRSRVDLPHPDGPSSATNSPASTERSIDFEHRQPRAVEFERVAHAANVDRYIARRRRRGAQRRCGRRHQMNPFCQPRRRSRATNKSLTMPAQISAMMTSVA